MQRKGFHRIVATPIVALALAAAVGARAQSFDPESCVTVALGTLVEIELSAFCRGYAGNGCAGEKFADACLEGARERERRQDTGGRQENQAAVEEMERNRRLVEQLPSLPPAANPLLGRWRNVPDPAPKSDPLGGLIGMAHDVACTAIAGTGPSFEFRADTLLHGARTMDSMRYYQGNSGVVFALGERYLRLLAFEFDGRDRMRNDTCSFERVGAVTATAASALSPKAAAVPPASKPGGSASPGCAVPTTRLGVDTVASVQRDIEARGGGSPSLFPGGLSSFRMNDLLGSYADLGADVVAVNYEFTASAPAGKMVAVTIVRRTSPQEFNRVLAERKTRITEDVGSLQQISETEFQASSASCRLRLIANPAGSYLYEIYQ